MVMAIINIKMEIIIMVIGKMITAMDREQCTIVMGLHTLADGKKENNMAMVFLLFHKGIVTMASG